METYKVIKRGKETLIAEYWDDLHIYTYRVKMYYSGGDILEFLEKWPHYRMVNFDNLNEFHRRTMILDN